MARKDAEGDTGMADRDSIELGEKVVRVQRRPQAGVVLSVRLSPEESDALESIADGRGMTLSQIAREALTGYVRSGAIGRPASFPWTVLSTAYSQLDMHVKSVSAPARTNGMVRETTVSAR